MEEAQQVSPWPREAEGAFVVVQTIAEGRGFPAHVGRSEVPLPPAGLPLAAIARLVILPCCELLSWPLMLLGALLGEPRKPAAPA